MAVGDATEAEPLPRGLKPIGALGRRKKLDIAVAPAFRIKPAQLGAYHRPTTAPVLSWRVTKLRCNSAKDSMPGGAITSSRVSTGCDCKLTLHLDAPHDLRNHSATDRGLRRKTVVFTWSPGNVPMGCRLCSIPLPKVLSDAFQCNRTPFPGNPSL
jgi:hypothetical protein